MINTSTTSGYKPSIRDIMMEEFKPIKEQIEQAPKTDSQDKKPDYSLVPLDLICEMLEPAYREGIHPKKYYRESWRIGFSMLRIYASLLRHLIAFIFKKEDFDPDAEELGIKKHHLGGAMFAIICMYDTWRNHPELDDRNKDWKKEKENHK